ncbi:APC family permease [Lactococcus nasutitermitis]|uniref:APC family permease n=1 Tax=Lactococcus nasutitermitis TaxID=1652957 RepID=A0ABV9JEC3_9LACT|nr:amino acid permease [Lactococcus nasutitermitis]
MGFMQKTDFVVVSGEDQHYKQVLTTRDFLALGVGTIISTSIFTLPGQVAAEYAGPAVVFSYLLAALVAGFVAFAYAEMSTVMPLAGSAYSWISVLLGEGFGWIAGWALLAEYFIAVAFVGAGFSANFQQLLAPLGFKLPAALAAPLGTKVSNGNGTVDLLALIVILLAAAIVYRGASDAGKISQVLIVLKIAAIVAFVAVGLTALHGANYHPFIPAHNPKTGFGGFQGIWAGVSAIFLAYIGFDSIAANSAEAKNPQKTMPRGILGSLVIAVFLFAGVTLVLVGMHPYSSYAGNAAPVGWALEQSGHPLLSEVVTVVALAGMFIALLGMILAGSRLIYAFGRDGLLPKGLGKMNKKQLPSNAIWLITIISVVIGALTSFTFLSQLISAGTLIAFVFVSIGMYALRPREGKDLPKATYKMPFYPVLPAFGILGSVFVFYKLNTNAQLLAGSWFVLGLVIYFVYGMWHSKNRKQ